MSSVIADVTSATNAATGVETKKDNRTQEEIDEDNALADRLSLIIEDANEKIVPICEMIRKVSCSFDDSAWFLNRSVSPAHREHGGEERGRS